MAIRSSRPITVAEQLSYFPSGKGFRLAGPSFSSTIADIAWIQIVQYYGWEVKTSRDYSKMKKSLFTLIDIDPNFSTPYTLGAFILLDNVNDFQGAIEILQKGILSNPDEWRYPFLIGFIYWISAPNKEDSLQNVFYLRASRYFRISGSKPGAPNYVLKFSSEAAKRRGEHLTSADIWLELYNSSELDEEKKIFIRNAKREIERYILSQVQSDSPITFRIEDLNLKPEHIFMPDGSHLVIDRTISWENQ
ncbi:hypothetical protein JXA84_06570 [candidate division WOR-3 bacterium]|nr:hypothetical protein [candidate division WOR-3 bacterium]